MEPIPARMERRSSKKSDSPRINRKHEQQRREESPSKTTSMSPFRSMRNRLFTEETIPVKNTNSQQSQSQSLFRIGSSRSRSLGAIVTTPSFMKYSIPDEKATPYTMTDENPFVSQSQSEDEEERQQQDSYCYANCYNDDVSSVSNDSARRINPNYALDQDLPQAPPAEIVVRKTMVSLSNNSYNTTTNYMDEERASAVAVVSPPLAPRHGNYYQDGTHKKNVLPLWQQNWVHGDIAKHHLVQQQLSPVSASNAVPKGTNSRPPPVNTTTPSPMVARPEAPRNEPAAAAAVSTTTAFTRVASPRLSHIPPLSPLRLPTSNVRCVSFEHNICKVSSLSPDLLRVNTEDTTAPTATTTPTTEDTSYYERRTPTHIQKPKVLTQRRATTGALAMTPSASLPLIVRTSRRQHEPKDDSGSTKPQGKTSNTKSVKDRLLLGGRPRKEIRGCQSVFSFGSIVGQSSSILTPTSNTTGTDPLIRQQNHASPSRAFGQMVKANEKFQKEVGPETFTPKRMNDLELLWQRCVAQPVRRITGGEDDAARLQRSRTGCLT